MFLKYRVTSVYNYNKKYAYIQLFSEVNYKQLK